MAWPLGSLFLAAGIFSTTFTTHHNPLCYFRLALAFPCLRLLAISWFPPGVDSATATLIYTGNILLCLKAVDVLIIGFRDRPSDIPRWVALSWQQRVPNGKPILERIPLPLPTTFLGRIAYTIDSMTTIQGRSFLRGRAFDWAPPSACTYQAGGRLAFLKDRAKSLIFGGLVIDALGTILEAQRWDCYSRRPLSGSGLSLPQQLIYSALVNVYSVGTSILALQFYTFLFIFLGSNPDAWPPLHRDYTAAVTLAELWSYRWHMTFRRSYQRITTPIFKAIEPFAGERGSRWLRIILSFAFATAFHLKVPYNTDPDYRPLPLLDEPAIHFGLIQPLGLLIETYLVLPATDNLPDQVKLHARRTYLLVWLLWIGRWNGDHYIRQDVFRDIPRWLPFHAFYRLHRSSIQR